MAIAIGVPLLVLFMALVMGVPFVYYLKRDYAYEATRGQPDSVRIKAWYGDYNEALELFNEQTVSEPIHKVMAA
jgi:hypothetical protein